MKLKPIAQQVVAVVGASSGIGRETALRFARQGAKVVVAARSESGLASLVEEIKNFGGEATAVIADVTDFNQVKAIADTTISTYGRLDTWVQTAGTSVFATFENTTPEEFKRVVDVTLMGQVYGAMVALPHLKKEGRGSLIQISSGEARRSVPYQSSYSAAKHGMEGYLEALRIELMHEGCHDISVTNIMPSSINTPFFNKTRSKLGVKPVAVPPLYDPSLVADAILYAAENPTRDFIVGDSGKVVDFLQKISPSLVDQILLAIAFKVQKTDEPKFSDAPDNLYQPVPEYDRIKGDFDPITIPSFTDWLDRNPQLKWGAIAAVTLGVAALLGLGGDRT